MSSDRPQSSSGTSRRLSWINWYSTSKDRDRDRDKDRDRDARTTLASPPEGKEVVDYNPGSPDPSTHSPVGGGLPFTRSSSSSALSASSHPSEYNADRPSTLSRRFSTNSVMSKQELDQEASKIIMNAVERTASREPPQTPQASRSTGGFSRKSFTSMMGGLGGLSALSLTRSSTDDKDRGRSRTKDSNKPRSSSAVSDKSVDEQDAGVPSRARSASPFRRRKLFLRDPSPSVEALKLSQSDVESDYEGSTPTRKSIRPRNAFSQSLEASDDESADDAEDEGDSDESWSDNDNFDPITVQNTNQNSLVPEPSEIDMLDGPDPLGEGVNIVIPPEPYFPSTLNASGSRNPRRKKSTKHVALPLTTGRPEFKRDRCTITLVQGDPDHELETSNRRPKRYIVGSDLSDESRYAVEWCIGTVLRDGDEMILVSVVENEAKVDPPNPNPTDRVSKLRNQQERQALVYILVRQVVGLLQRTKLHVTVICQAWHAKNSRHMLLDIVDYVEPTMLIVGSRGRGQIKGILLGSTSHYLVQKCSVPVMVARRRLRRPARRSAHLSKHRARKTLAEAAMVERVTPRVDREVENMRDELQRDDDRRENHDIGEVGDDEETEHEVETTPIGEKVAGD